MNGEKASSSTDDSDDALSFLHLIPNLPGDIALQCLARVPRLHHSNLSLVSKSWLSILRSPLFYSTRSEINCTQNLLHIIVRIDGTYLKWFVLDLSTTIQNPSRNVSSVPPIPVQAFGSAYAVMGPRIFVIGGSVNEIPSSNVWVFDCRFNKWELGPKMNVGRQYAAASVVDGRLYVLGGCYIDPSGTGKTDNWAEVFDPVSGSWAPIANSVHMRENWMRASAVIGNKIYAMGDRGDVICDPVKGSWKFVMGGIGLANRGGCTVVDGILYSYDYLGKIRGFDVKDSSRKELQGVDMCLPRGATVTNVGGKLCMVWWESKAAGKQMVISCAEVEVHKDSCGGLWGTIISSRVILVIPGRFSTLGCLAVEL